MRKPTVHSLSRRALPGLVVGFLFALAGPACQTTVTGSDGRPVPELKAPKPPPKWAKANTLTLSLPAPKPIDTNGNGYPDLIPVEVNLFSLPHVNPVYEPGAFVIALFTEGNTFGTPDATPLALWRIDNEAAGQAKFVSRFGLEGYSFRLSLMNTTEGLSIDQLPLINANIVGRFEPADGGDPVDSSSALTIQLGRRG